MDAQPQPTQSNPQELCSLHDPDWQQCCCNCIYHVAIHHHCTTSPERRVPGHMCCCGDQKGWGCAVEVLSEFPYMKANRTTELASGYKPRVYDNWEQHNIGCEMYRAIKPVPVSESQGTAGYNCPKCKAFYKFNRAVWANWTKEIPHECSLCHYTNVIHKGAIVRVLKPSSFDRQQITTDELAHGLKDHKPTFVKLPDSLVPMP